MSESTKGDAGRTVWKEALKRQVVGCFSAGLVGGAPQRDYLASLGLRADAIELGYNAVDNSYFADGANAGRKTADALRARLGLPQHYILASARFIEIKNLVGLLQAYAKFRQLCPDTATHLVLLGDGQLRPVLEAACSQLGLGPYVKLPGFKQYDQLPDYYALADAFVHVSRIEPWGLVVNEAMAAGLPVIVSRSCGCAADLVADGRNGFLVRHDDIEDIANHMKQLDELGPPARQAMRAASRTIVADYSPSRFAAGALAAATTAIRRGPAANGLARRGLLEIAARIV